jgi:hypothetical protein
MEGDREEEEGNQADVQMRERHPSLYIGVGERSYLP